MEIQHYPQRREKEEHERREAALEAKRRRDAAAREESEKQRIPPRTCQQTANLPTRPCEFANNPNFSI